MKLLHLGLILLVGVLLIKAVDAYNNKEGFDFVNATAEQKKYLKQEDKYWDSRLFPQVVKGGGDESKFLKLKMGHNASIFESPIKLNKTKTQLVEVSPSANVDKTETQKNIEKCRIINDTNDCDNIEPVSVIGRDGKVIPDLGCGYCYDTDRIIYGNKDGPFTDICTKKGWVPPGNDTAFFCKKKKEQELCKKMTDCGDSTGEKSICGWCPLTASGMPKKPGPNGGFVPKYDDDKCDWKGKMKLGHEPAPDKSISWLGWSPNKGGWPPRRGPVNAQGVMQPAPSPYGAPLDRGEGDCDNDNDCGPGMKCGHDGRGPDGKPGVPGLKYSSGGKVLPNSGYKDYCYDPNATSEPKFDGDLIQPTQCKKFEQMFPCVGPKMLTGPHSTACLQSQWQKSGCSGNLQTRVKDRNDYTKWNDGAYSQAGDNMRESIKKVALESSDYSKVEPAYKKCFGTDVEPCLDRFKPRPGACSKKLYKNAGCTDDGKLNPDNSFEWPSAYATSTWKSGQEGGWSKSTYTNKVSDIQRAATRGKTDGTWTNFDNVVDDNLKCFGVKPKPPFNKPCWRDFTLMMITQPGVSLPDSATLQFDKAPAFKNLLVVKQQGYWKNEYNWSGNYKLTQETYKKEHFPFWNFTQIAKNYWNNNWSLFKSKILKVPSVKLPSGKIELPLTVRKGSPTTWNPPFIDDSDRGGTRYRLGRCEGDCDSDSQCISGLKCFQRNGYEKIPGCSGSGTRGWDYCYNPGKGDCEADGLTFYNGSPFDNLTGVTTSKTDADNQGIFLKCGINKFISQKAFKATNFPYWYFIRVASVN